MPNYYTLNAMYEPEDLIQRYKTFIWTDGYDNAGEIKIVSGDINHIRNLLPVGKMIVSTESDQIMRVETHLLEGDENGKDTITVSGVAMSGALKERVWVISTIKNNYKTSWNRSGTAGDVAASMVRDMVVTGGGFSTKDIIPTLTSVNNSTDTATFDFQLKLGTLYERVREVCISRNLGFKIVLINKALRFVVYNGVNRTVGSEKMIFSAEDDTLTNQSALISDENYKTVAYVFSAAGFVEVAAPGFTTDITGPNRRVLYIDASDINPDTPNATRAMQQRGREELALNNKTRLVDGEVLPNYGPQFGTDYFLGDFVLVRTNGVDDKKMITQYTWISDETSDRGYPTFSEPE